MIEKIKISDNHEQEFDYRTTLNNSIVDLDEVMTKPPIALSIGSHSYQGNSYRNPTFTYGEFSAIVAASKSKKTFFKSALIASYIGGSTSTYFADIQTHRDENEEIYVIDIDTEQGSYYAQRAFRRVATMVGNPYVNYMALGVEGLEPKNIIALIDGLFADERYKGKIKWLSIDGIADLLVNSNDINESKEVANKLAKWRKENKCHINCVIHKNSTTDKATGHLGSFIEKKSETVILLQDTADYDTLNSPIAVSQVYSRGAPFSKFHFKLNEDTLPIECDFNSDASVKF